MWPIDGKENRLNIPSDLCIAFLSAIHALIKYDQME